MDANQKAAKTSSKSLAPSVIFCLVAVAFIVFVWSSHSSAEPYYFHGTITNIKTGPPYPIRGFKCKINIDKHYSEDRYLAYPMEADPDSGWMCKLKDETHIGVWVDRKKKKNGEWSDKGKVISMEILE